MVATDLLRRAINLLGLDVRRYDPLRSPARRRAAFLRERRIGLVIDVGANEGQWARGVRGAGYHGRVVCFEPLLAAFSVLDEPERHRVALGDRDGPVLLNVAGNSQSSSVRGMAARHLAAEPTSAYVATEEVPMRRLDSFGFREDAFLKLDAQGAELEILAGAEETVAHCVGLELELSLIELYEGQALACELLPYVYERGFRLLAIWPAYSDPLTAEVLQLDALFGRPER